MDLTVDYEEFYDTGERLSLFRAVEQNLRGLYTKYHKNGNVQILCNFEQGKVQGQYLEYHENEVLKEEKYYVNGVPYKYIKKYNDSGVLLEYHIFIDDIPYLLCAYYTNGTLTMYCIRHTMIFGPHQIIYNKYSTYVWKIDLSIIIPIRNIQRRFKKHMYNIILNELNNIIYIIDLSKMIIQYIKN